MSSSAAALFDYPIVLNLSNRLVVIVGAGTVGHRKLAGLLQCGARVRLIDPRLDATLYPEAVAEPLRRSFQPGDLAGAVLAFACSASAEVNQAVAAEAHQLGILCCCGEQSQRGDFSLPAVLRRGKLAVAVSTGGSSPALAAQLRDKLAEQVPDSWGVAVEIVAAVRRKWLTEKLPGKYNQQVLRNFWEQQLLPALEQGSAADVDKRLRETFGEDYSLAQLQVHLPEGLP